MGRNILAMGRRNELMWAYEKRLQYPIDIKTKDLKMAKYLVTQYGGANGELGAALRYLNQRYTMPDNRGKAILTDIGTEELAHIEMISTMIYQLTKDATIEELKERFKKIFCEEFDDPNESFMDFLLDLISKEKLIEILKIGDSYYYSQLKKYK